MPCHGETPRGRGAPGQPQLGAAAPPRPPGPHPADPESPDGRPRAARREEELRGTRDPTHFGRILQELGIGYIAARSPQAKGRIERFWQTLQDRLVSELRLRGISTAEAANAFLPAFFTDLNRRFARAPADAEAAWRPTPRDLAARLSCRYTRLVARDKTVRLGARWVQLPRRRAYAGRRVELRERLNGRLLVFPDGQCLAMQPAPAFVLTPYSRPRRG